MFGKPCVPSPSPSYREGNGDAAWDKNPTAQCLWCLWLMLLQWLQRLPTGLRINPQTPTSHSHLPSLCMPAHWLSFISPNTTHSFLPQDLCTCCTLCVKYFPLTSPGSNLYTLYCLNFLCSERPSSPSPMIRSHHPIEHPPHLLCCRITIHLNKSLQNCFLLFLWGP